MRLTVDTYLAQDSAIQRWAPKPKLVGLGLLILGFATVQQLRLVPVLLAITALVYALSGLPYSFLRSRLRYPGLFLIGVVVALPLLAGDTVLWQWGPIALRQEGLYTMLLVASRFLSIVTVGLVLMGTTPLLTLVETMGSLGLPPTLAEMILLAYRYLFDIAEELARLRQAMALRGFVAKGNRRSWQRLAAVAGTLLVRSYERSERVYKAMRLRGYGVHGGKSPPLGWGPAPDRAAMMLCGLATLGLFAAQLGSF